MKKVSESISEAIIPTERQMQILRLIQERGSLSINAAVQKFRVSRQTIRRDFDLLAAQGKARRVRGGAMAANAERRIAETLRVPLRTVSQAIEGKAGVDEGMRRLVLREARRLGYGSRGNEGNLTAKGTHVIGLVVPGLGDTYFSDILEGIEAQVRRFGYHVVLVFTKENGQTERVDINTLQEMNVEGLIIAPAASGGDTSFYASLQRENVPFVFIDRHLLEVKCSFVGTDLLTLGRLGTEHLLSLGYRRILHIAGPRTTSSAQEIAAGYRAALSTLDSEETQEWIIWGGKDGFEISSGYRIMKEVLARGERPEAVFAVNDEVAVGAYRALREAGLSVPNDIALVGTGGLRIGEYMDVPLTTVREPAREIGAQAASLLLEEIQSGETLHRRVLLAPELVVRQSCGAARVASKT